MTNTIWFLFNAMFTFFILYYRFVVQAKINIQQFNVTNYNIRLTDRQIYIQFRYFLQQEPLVGIILKEKSVSICLFCITFIFLIRWINEQQNGFYVFFLIYFSYRRRFYTNVLKSVKTRLFLYVLCEDKQTLIDFITLLQIFHSVT